MTTSATPSASSDADADWLSALLGDRLPAEGGTMTMADRTFEMRHGILRAAGTASAAQDQTGDTFGYKWRKRDAFDSSSSLQRARAWLRERYGDVATAPWWEDYGERPILVDAGCGAGYSVLELLQERLPRLHYLGVDISRAIDVAGTRFRERGLPGSFMQADITDLPLPDESVDVILSEGALHHTDSTEGALSALARLLKPGGRFLFYVYNKKGPIREFTDDYIRERLQGMSQRDAWNALLPLTRLGKILGELNTEIDIPESIDVLEIPAGKTDLQRLFYWHVFKAFYHPNYDIDEMNLINFDWYAPANAHRQTPDEVRTWCSRCGLHVEREVVEEAGITIVARKTL